MKAPSPCVSRSRTAPPTNGFTLIEVLLVLVILVTIGSIAVPMYLKIRQRADINAARTQIQLFESAIDTYEATSRRPPAALSDLIDPPSDPKLAREWSGPYLKANRNLIDPWQDPYQYTRKGIKNPSSYDVWSLGPDSQNNTPDDIGNWD